ncbi:hypothetical protein E3N88_23482 [Mikania micrantha]|uniref:Uncharacterized protein n=1 Tax=Mikania micrantha TaxID=192012 RepID=A0A5N6NDE5_9ASTR|nr:hypothetical protein E3N88_23482 [Mikania micrantha]
MTNVGENRAQNGVLHCPESTGLIAVRDGGVENPPRYAMLAKYQRFLRKSSRYAKPFWTSRRELNSIMEVKVLILELYLVNPCVAEQKTLIVLLVDTPIAGRIASFLCEFNLCAYDIGSCKSPLTSETSPLCFRNRFSDIIHEVTRGGGVTGWYQSHRDFDCTAMADQAEQYIYQRFPYLRLDDTPSSSAGSDSDPSEASSAASQATPAGPRTPSSPRPVTPPPPPSPVLPSAAPILPSPHHSPLVHTSAERRQDSSPRRVPAWDGLRRMRGQARKTTGLPPRRQMAPRDEPQTIHEVGESSHQAEWRAQLQQVTQDLSPATAGHSGSARDASGYTAAECYDRRYP